MDRLEAMSTFLTVVEQGSLSAAARRLKTPLTTVSRNVAELESHLRTKLFNRSSRQLVLTDTGTSYVAACKLSNLHSVRTPRDLTAGTRNVLRTLPECSSKRVG
jgi:DNA-binding transcriptional LysR family regulator